MDRRWAIAWALTAVLAGGCSGREGQDSTPPPPPAPPPAATAPADDPTPMPPPPATRADGQLAPTPLAQLTVPNPLATAAVGQWARYRTLAEPIQEQRVEVINVSSVRQAVRLEKRLFDEAGRPIGEPIRSVMPAEGVPRPPAAELSRETITVPAGQFDCVCVTVRGVDTNGVAYVNRSWYSDRAPVEGLVRREAVSEGRVTSGEELIAFGQS